MARKKADEGSQESAPRGASSESAADRYTVKTGAGVACNGIGIPGGKTVTADERGEFSLTREQADALREVGWTVEPAGLKKAE